jgi:predicted permease
MLIQNLRYALRQLRRTPAITSAAIICLALGIGATTAIFSVVNAVLLRQLPYHAADRLVRVFTEFPTFPNGGLRHFWMSPPELLDVRREVKSWDQLEAWVNGGVTLAGGNDAVRATSSNVTGGMLPMLGVNPLMGRLLSPQDDTPGAPLVAVISAGLWKNAYGGDPNILGRDVRLDGRMCRVVGVMPPRFEFPPGEVDQPDIWVPLQIDPARPGGRGSHFLSVLGRLKEGVTLAQANDEFTRLVKHTGENRTQGRHDFDPKNHPIVLNGFQDEVVKNVKLAMLVLLGAVVFVLLISSVNVANLLLARAESRKREIAVRKAIGAGLSRLLGQFVTEGIVLSALGSIFGLALAYGGLQLIVRANPGSLPRASEIGIDAPVLLFTIGVSVLTGIVFGFAPVMHLVGQNLHETLKAAAGRTTGGSSTNRFRTALVTVELALALVLLIGAGLLVKTFWKLQQVNAGLDPTNVLSMRVSLPQAAYSKPEQRKAFWLNLQSRVQSLPGVENAAVVTGLPPSRQINANDTRIEGFVPREGGPIQNIDYWNRVTPRYFETMGIRLIEGRLFDHRDGAEGTPTVIVNQTMARLYWPGQSAIGRRVRPGDPWRTVVGVVEDTKNAGLDRPTGTELYVPVGQVNPQFGAYLMVRAKNVERMTGAIRRQVFELDPAAPVSAVRMMDDVMSAARARPRFLSVLLTIFSSVALVLAAVGIYGVLSYSVAQRTSEIGIRMAMGADSGTVLGLVLKEGLIAGLIGTVLGAAGAAAVSRFLQGLLFGVSTFDVWTFAAMAGVLVLVTLLACYIPARRASAVDPMIALRYE